MRRAARTDGNHAAIVVALRAVGCSVLSDAKRSAAIANAATATALVRARVAARPMWSCSGCGVTALATAHKMRQKYCGKACVSTAYKTRLRGDANPNFKGLLREKCVRCDGPIESYKKDRKFCTQDCYFKYGNEAMRTSAKKDANHHSIVAVLESGGACVLDLSRAMYGVPDILVWHLLAWHLVEIKNPKTTYGRKGLNDVQKKWAEEWAGGPVYIMRTDDDANNFLIGELSELECVGGK